MTNRVSDTNSARGQADMLLSLDPVTSVDRFGQKCPRRLADYIGKQASFTRFKIVRYGGSLSNMPVSVPQEEGRDGENRRLRRNAIFAKSLNNRRIRPVRRLFCFCSIHPSVFQVHRRWRRNAAYLTQGSGNNSGNNWLRPCVIGDLAVFIQTGRMAQWPLLASRRQRSQVIAGRNSSLPAKRTPKERVWQPGHPMVIGGKAIFPDRDAVLFQLYVDCHRRSENSPTLPGAPSRNDQLYWPAFSQACGGSSPDLTGDGQWRRELMTDCSEKQYAGVGSEPMGQHDNIGNDCHSNDPYLLCKGREQGFAVYRKLRFGFWSIKLIAALLLFALLVAGLETFTQTHGLLPMGKLSAYELLSGMMSALAVMVVALLVMCVLIR